MQIDYPFHLDGRGRTAETAEEDHIRDMIEEVLFTSPGERVNRPAFGSGLVQIVFAPNSSELATATQFLVQGALQQWLGDRIQIESVKIEVIDSSIQVIVQYIIKKNEEHRVAAFSRSI